MIAENADTTRPHSLAKCVKKSRTYVMFGEEEPP